MSEAALKERAVAVATSMAPPVVSETAAIVTMIERAARDSAVDIDKMERLLQMQERVMDRQAKAAFDAAMSQMQDKLPVIVERGEIRIGSGKPQRYALWEDINATIKPVLTAHGFALSFRTGQMEGKITVTGILSHREGHREETTMQLPLDNSGSKNAVQAVGSSTSYGKRYTAAALLNLTSRGEDDDGNNAPGSLAFISEEQIAELETLIDDVNANKAKFLTYLKVDSLNAIPVKQYKAACDALIAKRVKP